MGEFIKKYSLIVGYILISIAIILILNTFRNNLYDFEIKNFETIVEPISINLNFDKKIENNDIKACFDSYCKGFYPKENFNGYFTDFRDKYIVDNFKIKLPKPLKVNEIDSLYIYSGSRNYHYNIDEIKTFKVNEDGNYTVLSIPKIDNYGGIFNHICVLFLSLFYNANYFIIPWILIFIAFSIFYFKNSINLSPKLIIGIIIIGIILRINHLTYVPLWLDELYTKHVALANFKATFEDPGNPPLFFILEYIFTKIFSNSDFSLRFLPMMFGILTIPAIWLLFKDISKNFALFASFMASINTIMIYHSQNARAYSLDMFLSIVAIYFLFKFLENPNTKNIVYNAIITALLINTNYYLIMIAGGNVLWGLIFAKGNKLKYFIANCIAGLTLIPYLLISFSTAIGDEFNSCISKPSMDLLNLTIYYYFLYCIIAIIIFTTIAISFVLYIIPKIKSNLKNKYFPYLFYIFNFTIAVAILISFFIKPILFTSNMCSIYGIYFLLAISAFYPIVNRKNKFTQLYLMICAFVLTSIFIHSTQPFNLKKSFTPKAYIDFILADAPKYHSKGFDIHGVIIDYKEFLSEYKDLQKLSYINWHSENMLKRKYAYIGKNDYTSKNNKVVIYMPFYRFFIYSKGNPTKIYENITGHDTSARAVFE